MNDIEIMKKFNPIWANVLQGERLHDQQRFLAHYASIEVFEQIFKNEEVWFSNPLFMNDSSEIRFVMHKAMPLIAESRIVQNSLGSDERMRIFMEHFNHCYYQFANDHVMDTYIFCLSEHDEQDFDGSLSMWRGYGSNGNGVSIVFDTSKIPVVNESPLMINKVQYITQEELLNQSNKIISEFAEVLDKANIPDNKISLAAFSLFQIIKYLSVFTKHKGFREEREWRIVYMKESDREQKLESMMSYSVSPRGIEPKLKLKIEPIAGVMGDQISLDTIVDHIILGPSISSLLAKEAVLRMMDKIGKSKMKSKIFISTIPFRAK